MPTTPALVLMNGKPVEGSAFNALAAITYALQHGYRGSSWSPISEEMAERLVKLIAAINELRRSDPEDPDDEEWDYDRGGFLRSKPVSLMSFRVTFIDGSGTTRVSDVEATGIETVMDADYDPGGKLVSVERLSE
jgi:hypothetical protein